LRRYSKARAADKDAGEKQTAAIDKETAATVAVQAALAVKAVASKHKTEATAMKTAAAATAEKAEAAAQQRVNALAKAQAAETEVERFRLTVSKTRVESACGLTFMVIADDRDTRTRFILADRPMSIYARPTFGVSSIQRRSSHCSRETSFHAWFQPLKLYYDETLSNFALNFNLRSYTEAAAATAGSVAAVIEADAGQAAAAAEARQGGAG